MCLTLIFVVFDGQLVVEEGVGRDTINPLQLMMMCETWTDPAVPILILSGANTPYLIVWKPLGLSSLVSLVTGSNEVT